MFIYITEGRVTTEENFVGFISNHEKTGLGLSIKVLNKIKQYGLDVKNARGQSYDNGANMAVICK
jgi:hypothetical protein